MTVTIRKYKFVQWQQDISQDRQSRAKMHRIRDPSPLVGGIVNRRKRSCVLPVSVLGGCGVLIKGTPRLYFVELQAMKVDRDKSQEQDNRSENVSINGNFAAADLCHVCWKCHPHEGEQLCIHVFHLCDRVPNFFFLR